MKTTINKCLIWAIVIAVGSIVGGCKKKDCIVRFYADGKPPAQSNVEIYNVDDLFKLYTIEYYDEDCDYSGVAEILSHNGDTVKVFGRFVDDWTGVHRWLLHDTSSSTISIGLSNDGSFDFIPKDSSIYIVTGKLKINATGYLMGKKANSTDLEDLKCTHLSMNLIEVRERKSLL